MRKSRSRLVVRSTRDVSRPRHRTRGDVLRFKPAFCPHPECPEHVRRDGHPERYRCQRRGTRRIDRAPGLVYRFSCNTCGRFYSSSAFFDCYRRRYPRIREAVFRGYCEGQSGRQIARTLGISLKRVQLDLRRMARQLLLFHLCQLTRLMGRLDLAVVFDGLRTFAGSQWEPGDLNTAVAAGSQFWLDVDYVGRMRGGRMTSRQQRIAQKRMKRLGKPPRGAATKTCLRALERIAKLLSPEAPLKLATDEDKPTLHAVRQLGSRRPVAHTTISSRAWREAPGHPLWPVNHEHRLARHALKNHARETIAFSKTAAGVMDRAIMFMAWRNNVKGNSERDPVRSRITPAMMLGLTTRPLLLEEMMHARLFPDRVKLPAELRPHYLGQFRSRPGENASAYRHKTRIAA